MFNPSLSPEERRLKRCFQRVNSGLEKGGDLRFMTLTSSDRAERPIQKDFVRLARYLRRQGLLEDYIRVVEVKDDQREHIHLVGRGKYIRQASLSNFWNRFHRSPIVDIRRVRSDRRNRRAVAHELAKYMVKEIHRRYSWSWGWVYKGFVKTWRQAVHLFLIAKRRNPYKVNFGAFLKLWQAHLRSRSPPRAFLNLLCGFAGFQPIF